MVELVVSKMTFATNEDIDGRSLSLAGNHTILFLRHFALCQLLASCGDFSPAVFECVHIAGKFLWGM